MYVDIPPHNSKSIVSNAYETLSRIPHPHEWQQKQALGNLRKLNQIKHSDHSYFETRNQ